MGGHGAGPGKPRRIINCRPEGESRDRPHSGDCHKPQTDLIAAGGLFHAPVQLAVGFVKHRTGIEQRQKGTRQVWIGFNDGSDALIE